MTTTKFLNLVALAAVAIFGAGFAPLEANALAASHGAHLARDVAGHHVAGHSGVAKRKRASTNNSKRCKPRTTSSAAPSSTSTSATPTSTSAPAPKKSNSSNNNGSGNNNNNNNNNGNDGGNNDNGSSAPAKSAPGTSTKLGLAWGGSPEQLSNFKAANNMPLINWSPSPPYNAKSLGFNFIPMFWGYKNDCSGGGICFGGQVKASDISYAAFVNEPNEGGQANMSPGEAVKLWWKYMQPLANQGVKTLGPVTSSDPNGLTWVKNFYDQCNGCTVDKQPVHWYDTTAQKFIDYVTLWHNTFNKPIWVTEYACQNYNNDGKGQCSWQQIVDFQNTVTGWMDSQWFVEYYMPFGLIAGQLPDGVNQLNQLIGNNNGPTTLAKQIGY